MMNAEKKTCCATVHSGSWSRGRLCGKTAGLEHEGQWYCKRHHPPTVQAKATAAQDKWQAKWAEKTRMENEKAIALAVMQHKAACFDDLLGALSAMIDHRDEMLLDDYPAITRARAAIAKAKGQA